MAVGTLLACGDPSPPSPPAPREPPTWNERLTREAESLETRLAEVLVAASPHVTVRLAYAAGADLDLYVSDPLQESVYYGNTPSVSGGALDRDLRCQDPAPRIEHIDYAAPPPGRYRVSVDHPQRCDGEPDGDVMAFVIAVDVRGKRRTTRGLIRAVTFLPVVLEFEVADSP